MSENTVPKKKKALFIVGLLLFIAGASILLFFGGRFVYRRLHRAYLLKHNPVIEISELDIKAPILEGTDNDVLDEAVGHFTDTGDFGKGNYCIAGHSSTIYKYDFNELKNAEVGMKMTLKDCDGNTFTYSVAEKKVVEPSESWILRDFGDDRLTLVTCNDDGSKRIVIIGKLCK